MFPENVEHFSKCLEPSVFPENVENFSKCLEPSVFPENVEIFLSVWNLPCFQKMLKFF